jgi:putative oxidoreductase
LTLVPGLAGLLELIGGVLVTVGLFTRIVAFILSGEMAFAYFMAHAPRSIFPLVNAGELAVMYCFVFFYLAFAGPGPWSLDHMRKG